MAVDSTYVRVERGLMWTIRGLAIVEVVDSLVYLGYGGWFSASPILIALVAVGLAGAALTWIRSQLALIGLGGLLVAFAPAIAYPLSILLLLYSLIAIALPAVRAARRRLRGEEASTRA